MPDDDRRQREKMEARYGELGSGLMELTIGGKSYGLRSLLQSVGLLFEDITPIDAVVLGGDLYAIRYFDVQDRNVVAYEFRGDFSYVTEQRVHVAEWMGDAYYTFRWSHGCSTEM